MPGSLAPRARNGAVGWLIWRRIGRGAVKGKGDEQGMVRAQAGRLREVKANLPRFLQYKRERGLA